MEWLGGWKDGNGRRIGTEQGTKKRTRMTISLSQNKSRWIDVGIQTKVMKCIPLLPFDAKSKLRVKERLILDSNFR